MSSLSRLAIVYVRQSSPGQVRNHRESTERQYALEQRAREFGWPEGRVETIDGDLGMSGAVAGRRRGVDQLCRQIAVSDVGAVFGIEVSRLARNTVEWFQLLDLCRRSNTVIVEDSHVYAPGRNDDDLVLGIKGTISASELSIIKARLDGGKRNKAMRGALYSNLPAGYVLNGERLSKDSDPQVQALIERVFRAFLEAGSAVRRQLLRDPGVRLPVCRHGQVNWQDADYSRIQAVLKNPMMAGVYAWARRGGPVDGPICEQWRVWIPDHHEAYVDLPTWYRIQEQLFRNQGKRASDRSALREGPALLQGLDKPRGFAVIGRVEARSFLAGKPVGLLWGVGTAMRKRLARDGITLIGELARLDEAELVARYGKIGGRLDQCARGEDDRPVDPNRETKSISSEITLDADLSDADALRPILWRLAETVARRLKKAGLAGGGVTLKLKTAEFRIVTRACRLNTATQSAEEMFRAAEPLLTREADGRAFRLIGIGAHDLIEADRVVQSDLFGGIAPSEDRIDKALDAVRDKFGDDAIVRGRGFGTKLMRQGPSKVE